MQQVVEQIIEDEQPRVKIMSMRAFLTDDTNLPDVIQPNRTYGIFIKVQTVPGSQVSYQIRVVNRNAKQDDEPLERSEVRELTVVPMLKGNKILLSSEKRYDHAVKFQVFFFHKMTETILFQANVFTKEVTFFPVDSAPQLLSVLGDIENISSDQKRRKAKNSPNNANNNNKKNTKLKQQQQQQTTAIAITTPTPTNTATEKVNSVDQVDIADLKQSTPQKSPVTTSIQVKEIQNTNNNNRRSPKVKSKVQTQQTQQTNESNHMSVESRIEALDLKYQNAIRSLEEKLFLLTQENEKLKITVSSHEKQIQQLSSQRK